MEGRFNQSHRLNEKETGDVKIDVLMTSGNSEV